MVKYINEYGEDGSDRKVEHHYCNLCKQEKTLYRYAGSFEVCLDCLKNQFDVTWQVDERRE